MQQKKIIKVFDFLSAKELKAFKLFTDSPFHNTNTSLHQLNLAILHYYEKGKPLDPKRIWKRAFSPQGRAYKDHSFTQELSKLYQLLQQFLLVNQLLQNEVACQNQLRLSFRAHGADEQFKKISLQTAPPTQSNDWQEHQRALNYWDDLYAYPSLQRNFQDPTYPHKIQTHLDNQYFLLKLKYGLDIVSRTKTYHENSEITLLKAVIAVTKNVKEEAPLVYLYRTLIVLHQHFDLANYDACRQFYLEVFDQIPTTEKPFLLIKFLNLAFDQILNGHPQLDKVCLALYQFGLANDMMTLHEKMAESTFVNIVIYGASTQAFEFTEKFIADYQLYVHEEMRKTVVNLAFAYLRFYQKNYLEALHLLNTIVTYDLYYKLRIDSLNIRVCYCLYEQQETNLTLLKPKMEAFAKYIRRDIKIAKPRIKSYENYLFLFKQLIGFQKGILLIDDLESAIHCTTPVVAKNWFLRKLTEIKQG